MLLGKRPRPPIRRTTSMTGITVDMNNVETQEPSDTEKPNNQVLLGPEGPVIPQHYMGLSPRNHRRSSADLTGTPHFLRTCGLCKRRLVSGRDLYMYRGDTAFCSLECREQKMKEDEKKEKCMASNEEHHTTSSNSKASGKRQTVVAA